MLVWRFKPKGTSNFGDALNDYLWPRLLPTLSNVDATFYGIGTVLGTNVPEGGRHIVFGAGIGYGGLPPIDDKWKIYFVRGPRTSEALGGVPYITDPGILARTIPVAVVANGPAYSCSFMPRWDSISSELVRGCEEADIHVIDPRERVEKVMQQISDTSLLLTEALHGAVAADSIRVPWVSIYGGRGHEFKWNDWCSSLDMVWNPIDMTEFTLDWARRNAVPQLSAKSILLRKVEEMEGMMQRLREDFS